VGLISAALDLLIFGSLLAQPDRGSPIPHAWLWIPGWFLLSTTLAVAGAAVGGGRRANRKSQIPNLKLQIAEPTPNWTAALAWITCAAVLLLLAAGGLVTGFRAGMAVPDWPNTFGSNMFLFPLAQMTGGVFYEHAHRLLGTLAGSAALALAIELTRTMPERKAIVRFSWILGTAVAVQGVFGGLRVVDDSHCLAVVHGFFAHAIFGGLVAVAAILSREGRAGPRRADRLVALLAVAAILLQTLLGTLLRQLGLGLFSHLTLAVGVVLTSLGVGIRAWRPDLAPPLVRRCAIALMLLVVVQIDLGLAAVVCRTPAVGASPTFEAICAAGGRLPVEPLPALVTTAHQTTAAVLLALAVMLVVWACPAAGSADLAKPQAATGRQIP
jgi:cytochrome c oxidase assembly protein subunit 15